MTLKKRLQLLTELEITEISLVDKGASPGSDVLFFKRDSSDVSKALPDPKAALGIQLLRVLSRRVENTRMGRNINRLEAWVQVLETPEGQRLLDLITKAKSDPSMFQEIGKQDVEALADFLETANGQTFLEAFSKQLKKGFIVSNEMETVTKIFKKSFDSQIEAMDSLKLELNKQVSGDDKRTAEQRLVNYIDNHPDLESAIRELPNVVKVEVQEKPDFGPTYREIEKLAAELVIKGVVPTQEQGVVKIVKDNPGLYLQYLEEQV